MKTTEEQREYAKNRYWAIRNGTWKNTKLPNEELVRRAKESSKKHYQNKKEKIAEYQKERRKKIRKEQGLPPQFVTSDAPIYKMVMENRKSVAVHRNHFVYWCI